MTTGENSNLPLSFPSFRRTLGLLALISVVACGGGGGTDSDTDGEGGEDGEGANGSGANGSGANGSGAGSPDCNGNPITGDDEDDVVNQLDGVTVTTFAGSANPGAAEGEGESAQFNNPVNVLIDGDGVLIADFDNGRIRRATADGTVSTVTSQAGFARPFGMAIVDGELIVQTDYNEQGMAEGNTGGVIWSVNLSTGDATALVTDAGKPRGITLLSGGTLATADIEAMTVRTFDLSTSSFADLAGSAGCPSFLDGSGTGVRFDRPYGMVVLDGDLLVADMENNRIRRVSPSGEVSSFAGDGVADMIDGDIEDARFNRPKDLAIDGDGNVYVSDVGNHRIRRIRSNGVVETIAGDGTAGFADGDGGDARFYGQEGIDVTADGKTIYVADGTDGEMGKPYHRVRKISLP